MNTGYAPSQQLFSAGTSCPNVSRDVKPQDSVSRLLFLSFPIVSDPAADFLSVVDAHYGPDPTAVVVGRAKALLLRLVRAVNGRVRFTMDRSLSDFVWTLHWEATWGLMGTVYWIAGW